MHKLQVVFINNADIQVCKGTNEEIKKKRNKKKTHKKHPFPPKNVQYFQLLLLIL